MSNETNTQHHRSSGLLTKIPEEPLRRVIYSTNLQRMVKIGPIFFIVELCLLPLQHQLLDIGNVLIIFLIANMVFYPVLLYVAKYQKSLSEWIIRLTYQTYVLIVVALCSGLSLKGLMSTDLLHLFILAIIAISVFFTFSALEHAVILILSIVPYLIMVPILLLNKDLIFVIFSNTLVFGFLAWLFGRIGYRTTVYALEDRKKLEEQNILLSDLVDKDQMTNLLNHRASQEKLREEIRHTNESGIPFTVLLFDIDNFKQINDTCGHLCGDDALRKISAVLRSNVDEGFPVGRYGGDEFIIIMPHTTVQGARVVASKLWNKVESLELPDSSLTVTLSGGIEQYSAGKSLSVETAATHIIASADEKLFKAKQNGKNRFVTDL